jgi:hypothetical protein
MSPPRKLAKSALKPKKQVRFKPKKRKYVKIRKQMLRPKHLRNMIRGNSLEDWLERYHDKKSDPAPAPAPAPPTDAREFLVNHLRQRLDEDDLVVLDRPLEPIDGTETLKCMKNQVPVIVNAQLIDRSAALGDIVDLLVRSDYLVKLGLLNEPQSETAALPLHYVIVGMRGDPSIRYVKTQLYMQNLILIRYQHIDSGYALIAEKELDNVGIIKFNAEHNRFTEGLFHSGSTWMNKLNDHSSKTWSTTPPSVPELYANAKLTTPWAQVIHDIALKQDDITLLEGCWPRHRAVAHKRRKFKVSQLRSSKDVGYKETSRIGRYINRYIKKDWNKVEDIELPPRSDYDVYFDLPADCEERSAAKSLYKMFSDAHERDPVEKYHIYCWDIDPERLYDIEFTYPEYPLGTMFAHRLIDLHQIFIDQEIILPCQTDISLQTISRVLKLKVEEDDVLKEIVHRIHNEQI